MNVTEENYASLLNHLKMTVENILVYHAHNTWNTYGDLHRLHKDVVSIIKHGFRFSKDNGEPDFWVFIQGLTWLQPTLATSPSFLGNRNSPIRSPVRNSDKALTWIYKCIESYTLSEKLSWLLSDHEHLISCYKPSAFLRQLQYSEAMLICLRAVEQRQLSLLTKLDPSLYEKKKQVHRRSSSYPERKTIDEGAQSPTRTDQPPPPESPARKSVNVCEKVVGADSRARAVKSTKQEQNAKDHIKKRLLKKYFSTSDLYLIHYKEKHSHSFSVDGCTTARRLSFSESTCATDKDSNAFLSLLRVRYDKRDSNSSRGRTNTVPHSETSDSTDSLSTASSDMLANAKKSYKHKRRRSSLFKLPFRIWEESDDENRSVCSEDSKTLVFAGSNAETNCRKSFIENGGNITLPMSMGSFAGPSPGQSLMSFLSSGVFTNTNAELDRENAHFNVSEAMIATLEQVKFNQQLHLADEILEESDEEINHLKRIIRIRRRQKQNEKNLNLANTSEPFSSETTDATITTDQSVNSLSSSVHSTSESISTDVEDEETDKKSNLLLTKKTGLSVSKTSVFSSNLHHIDSNSSISAESVAISLLRRFKENQLPAASEIEWLVSERDAPQQILPLPNSLPVSDEYEARCDRKSTLLRGTSEWAPPRPQIIFTPHPSPIRRHLMEKQSYRCAGCGSKVPQKYASKYRYCEYLGRYFCTGCHDEQTSFIPGRILSKWDFNKYVSLEKYPVSNFSFRLLDQMSTDPLFNVMDLNPLLYKRVRDLQKTRILRVSLFYLKDFIFNCKYTEKLQETLKCVQAYIYNDPDCYSIVDFAQVKFGKLFKTLSDLVKSCENHVKHCQLCQARGFMCEICAKKEIIFPWELNLVIRCGKCGSCHHIKCYKQKLQCPKCIRMDHRNDVRKVGASPNEGVS